MNGIQDPPAQGVKNKEKAFKLPSGATLYFSRPGYQASADFRNALTRAFGAMPVKEEEMKATLSGLKENPSTGGALIQRALHTVSSEDVDAALFGVFTWALYGPADSDNRLKVNKGLFDDPEHGDAARADFYPMAYCAVEVAVLPFLGPLVSMYMEFLKKVGAGRASTLKSPPSAS